jgi:hypothetical protein
LKARLTKYGLCALFVAVMAYVYLLSRDFAGAGNKERYQLLCDALTVPGVLLVCAGALVWVSSLGALDGLSYGLRLAFRALIPGKRLQKEESYHDYVRQRQAKQVKGYGFLLISGTVTVILSLLFLGLYYL